MTIAVEMVANPKILFMDEPTTGLDTIDALNVMKVRAGIQSRSRRRYRNREIGRAYSIFGL